jgi:hypothetical protein
LHVSPPDAKPVLNKAYDSFSWISLIAFISVNFEKSFNRAKKLVGTLQYNKYLNQACRKITRLEYPHPPLWHLEQQLEAQQTGSIAAAIAAAKPPRTGTSDFAEEMQLLQKRQFGDH